MHLSNYMSCLSNCSKAGGTCSIFETFKSLYYKQLLLVYFFQIWLFFGTKGIAEFFQKLCYCSNFPKKSNDHPLSSTSLPWLSSHRCTAWLCCPFTLMEHSFPLHLSLSSSSPVIRLTSSCFSCRRWRLSKCLREELLSFLLALIDFQNEVWGVFKESTNWWAKNVSDTVIIFGI